MPAPHDPYKKYVSAASHAADFAGAGSGVSNPMGSVQNMQASYHMHQYHKDVNGMRQAVINNDRANQARREMNTGQGQASVMVYGQNGITRENGYVQDANGQIRYVGR
ncbi:hypothetical protein BDW74DRAFT_183718 [Aspergillus multicolor]|uniref:uncharacterized protein n=1 Tax=Aspergillus multicolor TaxID=41759 RepID=UPI003CCDA138